MKLTRRLNRFNRGRSGAGVALIALVALGCSSATDPGPDPGPVLSEIVGSWNWVLAVGGVAGEGRTPETDGVARLVVIDAPDRIRLFENGGLSVDTTFEIVPAGGVDEEFIRARLVYASPVLGVTEQSIAFSIEGGLLLIDPCCDLWTWEFTATP